MHAAAEVQKLELAPASRRVAEVNLVRNVLGWPKKCKLTHVFLWEYRYKRLKLTQLLGQLGVFFTPGGM